jgi:hypothetical protein
MMSSADLGSPIPGIDEEEQVVPEIQYPEIN